MASFNSSSGANSFLSTKSNYDGGYRMHLDADGVCTHLMDEQEEMSVACIEMR